MTSIDAFDLAAAIRAAGIAEGRAALNLAADLTLRLIAPSAKMICEAALDRAATITGVNPYLAKRNALGK